MGVYGFVCAGGTITVTRSLMLAVYAVVNGNATATGDVQAHG